MRGLVTGKAKQNQLYLFVFEFDYEFFFTLPLSFLFSDFVFFFLVGELENKWIIISRPPERPISFLVHFVYEYFIRPLTWFSFFFFLEHIFCSFVLIPLRIYFWQQCVREAHSATVCFDNSDCWKNGNQNKNRRSAGSVSRKFWFMFVHLVSLSRARWHTENVCSMYSNRPQMCTFFVVQAFWFWLNGFSVFHSLQLLLPFVHFSKFVCIFLAWSVKIVRLLLHFRHSGIYIIAE